MPEIFAIINFGDSPVSIFITVLLFSRYSRVILCSHHQKMVRLMQPCNRPRPKWNFLFLLVMDSMLIYSRQTLFLQSISLCAHSLHFVLLMLLFDSQYTIPSLVYDLFITLVVYSSIVHFLFHRNVAQNLPNIRSDESLFGVQLSLTNIGVS